MTPELKAKELVGNFHYQICNDCGMGESDSTEIAAKQCALICVDEIMAANLMGGPITMYPDTVFESESLIGGTQFWRQVKQSILNS